MSVLGFLQRIADLITICLGFSAGYWFYTHYLHLPVSYSYGSYLLFGILSAALFLIVLHGAKLYEQEISLLNLVETRGLLWVWLISSMITLTVTFYIRPLDLSRVMVTASLVCTLGFLIIERAIFYRFHLALHLKGINRKKIIVYGAGIVGRHILKRIYQSPALGLMPVGVLDDNRELWGTKVHIPEINPKKNTALVLGALDQLEELVRQHDIKEIFLALPSATYERTLEIVRRSRSLDLKISIVPHTFENQIFHMQVEELGGIPVMREKKYRAPFVYLVLKRLFDIILSTIILFLLTPIFLVVAILIKMDSPGPVIFRQNRVGQGGKLFTLYKFRTMHVDSPAYAVNPLSSSDPRITRVGRLLRRSSLDELPQFFNVIFGDMSIVGPRPEMPFIVEGYQDIHKERLLVRPGITGIWQISAVRGEAIHANIEYDLFYIENQSFLLDLIIVLRTILVAIRGIGAY